ncbi:MAG TPA: DUF697 domain-containing protein [Saprospiraceae bacterium]|nr:DUF697 domain-containing protein [Saprospiraceae bacterium]HNT18878.1 DUF697 domain-containing protein [Saprospiraceae bacterium]
MTEHDLSEKAQRDKEVDSVIRNHLVWSMGAGFIPVPVADFFAVSAIQLDMVRQLCRVYDIEFKETEGKAIISSITSSGLARLAARTVVKFIPGAGSFIGGMAVAVLSGASTYALGQAFRKHFETGGTFLDFDLSRLKKIYDEMFEKGKDVAEQIRKEEKQTGEHMIQVSHGATAGIIDKLSELGKMKDQGLITEDEFLKMKEKLLSEI